MPGASHRKTSPPAADSSTETSIASEAGFLLRALLENSPDQIYFKDRDSRFLALSEATAHRLGLRGAGEALGKNDYDFFAPDFAKLGYDTEQELMNGGETIIDVEREEVHSDGHVTWASTTKLPLVAPNGEVIGLLGVNRDISAAKEAEQAVSASVDRLIGVAQIQRDIARVVNDPQAARELVAERTRELIGADCASILMLEGKHLVCVAASGSCAQRVGTRVKVLARTPMRKAMETLRPVELTAAEGIATSRSELVELIPTEIKSMIAVPLAHEQTPIGMLCVATEHEDGFEEGIADNLELIGLVLSAALASAAQLEERRQREALVMRMQAIHLRAPIGIATIDRELRLHEANPEFCQLLDREKSELEGLGIDELVAGRERARERHKLMALVRGEADSYANDVRLVRGHDVVIWAHLTGSLVRDIDGEPMYAVIMVENITEHRKAQEAVREQAAINEYQALHDSLTGLPNRMLFQDRLEFALSAAKRDESRVAVLMFDLDRFKEVNDTLGHAAGDVLLKEMATRLQKTVRASDTFARLGGDEFGMVLPGQSGPHDVMALLDKVRDALADPVELNDLPLKLDSSIGVALFPDDGDDAESLLRHADLAMYRAKAEGKEHAFYEEQEDDHTRKRLTLVGELRRALDEEEIVLYYQPKATLKDRMVDSVEALIRWEHPERGLVPPMEFIPVIEQTGLIKPLTRYVIDRALDQIVKWREGGLVLSVAVNLATRNLIDMTFPDEVKSLLEKHNVEPKYLELEITESNVLEDTVRTKQVLERLDAMGIRISVDDFGTGYSTLSYLKDLPVSELKIDRSFVMDMLENPDDKTIVQSTIDLGRNLKLDVVAEGVEDQETWDELRRMGCNIAQGYFLGRPMPAEELSARIREIHDEDEADAAASAPAAA